MLSGISKYNRTNTNLNFHLNLWSTDREKERFIILCKWKKKEKKGRQIKREKFYSFKVIL